MRRPHFETAAQLIAEENEPKVWPGQVVFRGDQELYLPPPPEGYWLGDDNLPIAKYRRAHEELFGGLSEGEYPVGFVVGETGCGKTTNVPLAALETGLFDKILVAQPYILLARETRKRLIWQLSNDLGYDATNLVGFATAAESELHADNRIICGTYGHVNGMIAYASSDELDNTLLCVDEFHDRSVEGDTVLEVGKAKQIPSLVMSATINADELAVHHCRHDGMPAPILKMEGRTFPIEEREMDNSTEAALWSMRQGYDTLYMLPRKTDVEREIGKLAASAARVQRPYVLLPLHSEMAPSAQDAALDKYELPKMVVATEIAGTGITPDVDAVIVSGLGRTTALQKGVSALTLQHLPEARVRQHIGRCGRNRPGIAIRAPYSKTPKNLPPNPETYDKPEIMRTRIDSLLLRLACAGLRLGNTDIGGLVAQRLDYKDLPSDAEVQYAIERLQKIGALTSDLAPTDTGKEMATLPVDVQYARMVVDARKYPEDVHRFMIAAACVAQFNGVATSKGDRWKSLSTERRADMLRDLDVYIRATQMHPDEWASYSILPQRIEKVDNHITELYKREGYSRYGGFDTLPTNEERRQLLECVLSGVDELFIRHDKSRGYGDIRDKRIRRRLMGESALRSAAVVAGTPWNLETITEGGRLSRKYFITNGVSVELSRLAEQLPERCRYLADEYEIIETGDIIAHHELYFDNRPTGYREQHPVGEVDADIRDFVVNGLFQFDLPGEENLPDDARRFRKEINDLRDLEHRATYSLGVEDLLGDIRGELKNSLSTHHATLQDMFAQLDGNSIRGFLSNKERKEIYDSAPDRIWIGDSDTQRIGIPVAYHEQDAYLSFANHEELRMMPDSIPDLDGRKMYARIGKSTKWEEYFTTREKYRHTRSRRRKSVKK